MIFHLFLTHHCTYIETIYFCNREKRPTENSIWMLYSCFFFLLIFFDTATHLHQDNNLTDFTDLLVALCCCLVHFDVRAKKSCQILLTFYILLSSKNNIRNTIGSFGDRKTTILLHKTHQNVELLYLQLAVRMSWLYSLTKL